jgi:Winged helix domain, variant/ATPase family associated with various cellular activities (AAA)
VTDTAVARRRRHWYSLRRGAPETDGPQDASHEISAEHLEVPAAVPGPPAPIELVSIHHAKAPELGSFADLVAPLERLDRILARAVDRVTAAYGSDVAGDPFRGLYISAHDAVQWSHAHRVAPILGVAEGEPELIELVDDSSPLGRLARGYGLTSFDLDLVVLALAPEIEHRYERLYAFLQDDVSRRSPSVDLGLNLLCPTLGAKLARRARLASDAPLVRHDIVELVPDQNGGHASFPSQSLRLDNAVIRYLLRQGGIDPRLRHVCTLLEPYESSSEMPLREGDRRALEAMVQQAHAAGESLVLYLSGPETAAKRDAAQALATNGGRPLLAIDAGDAVVANGETPRLMGTAFREATLQGAVLFVEPLEALLMPDAQAAHRRFLEELRERRGVTILAGSQPSPPREGLHGIVHVPFPMPTHTERRAVWAGQLATAGIELAPSELDDLAGRFRLTADQIADAASVARNRARMTSPPSGPSLADLFDAARTRSDAALTGLARKIDPAHGWAQLVLPDDSVAQLREICAQVVQRHRVLDEWGFGEILSLGKGVTALFAGPSGTGKTTAADIIARELGLDLYKIDLSAVVSKYIGETEKNLERIFSAAENANAILFFDEADALFGRRSEVRDSHDRYANLEIAYLLQRMEQYEGVAILATNLRQNMDEAFVRRLQFVVEFPFPDESQRSHIWPLLFPADAERDDDIDFAALARSFRITGGSIKNIVLGAAFLAANESQPIGTRHLLHATRREYLKLGRVLSDADVAPFAEVVTG